MTRKNGIVLLLAGVLVAGLMVPLSLADEGEREREESRQPERRKLREDQQRQPRQRRAGAAAERPGPRRRRGPADGARKAQTWRRRQGPFRVEEAERMERMIQLIERLRDTCFDEPNAALIAIGGLKSEVRRKPEAIIDDLEQALDKTKTLGLRNAIRLTLKDIYKAMGKDDRVLDHLRAMLAENDEAIQARMKQREQRRRSRGEEHDD